MEWEMTKFIWDEYDDSCLYLTMTTGDLKNNLRKLCTSIKAVEYPGHPNVEGLSQGKPEAFIDLYRHAFLLYSQPLTQLIAEKNIDIAVKGDARFVEAMYKTLREVFTLKPPLTQTQFFSRSYAEKKMIMCTEILLKVREKHKRLSPKCKGRGPGSNRKLNFPRPATAPVKSIDENDAKETKIATPAAPAPVPSAVYEQLMAEMNKVKKVGGLEDVLHKMFDRLNSLESRLIAPVKPSLPPSSLIESLAARLAVLESKVEGLENAAQQTESAAEN